MRNIARKYKYLLGIGVATLLFTALGILIWAATTESDEEKANYLWEIRVTVNGNTTLAATLDERKDDAYLEKCLQDILRPLFDLPVPEDAKTIATLEIKHEHKFTTELSGKKLRRRIKSNFGMDMRPVKATFSASDSLTCQRYLIPNPSGGITLGCEIAEEGIQPEIEFSPTFSREDRIVLIANNLVRLFRTSCSYMQTSEDLEKTTRQMIQE